MRSIPTTLPSHISKGGRLRNQYNTLVSGADSVEYLQRVRAIFEEKICPKAKKAVNAQLDTFEFVLNLKHKKELMAVGGLSRPSGPGLSNPLG